MLPTGLAHATADAVARRSYGKLVAYLAARTRDLASAEDALSSAFAAALASWPRDGCPANPEAWLLTVARRKAIDAARRNRASDPLPETLLIAGPESADIPDRRLALLFVCAHPAIEAAIRAPLMLQLIVGLDAARIASAFLIAPATMGKRLVRAKQKIQHAGIPFEVPGRDELPARLDSVLHAVYATFGEGWHEGEASDLAEEAVFLARLIAELLPEQAEALGLAALLLHAHGRRGARRDAGGNYVPLSQQDRALWDWPMIQEAEGLLRRAGTLGAIGRFQLEAAIQSAHVYRLHTGIANWEQIVQLYDALCTVATSPVTAVNRALAIAEAQGAGAGVAALPDPGADSRLEAYQPYWAARADLLARTGVRDQAADAYRRAIGLARDPAVRRFLSLRLAAL